MKSIIEMGSSMVPSVSGSGFDLLTHIATISQTREDRMQLLIDPFCLQAPCRTLILIAGTSGSKPAHKTAPARKKDSRRVVSNTRGARHVAVNIWRARFC